MKNIHVVPTDKETRLYLSNYGKELNLASHPKTLYTTGQNIYITSDEEIKEGDWCLDIKRNIIFQSKRSEIGTSKKIPIIICTYEGCYIQKDCKKIILTTDQDLIKDGVQAIDDEFLEWFVKNPSCEEVEVKDVFKSSPIGFGNAFDYYKIIIPKEEPKQETLEEAAVKQWGNVHRAGMLGFIDGAKWQQERSYSDEEVIELLQKALTHKDNGETGNLITAQGEIRTANFYSWFEQFKKKDYEIYKRKTIKR